MSSTDIRSAFISGTVLLLVLSIIATASSQQPANNGQEYSLSLIVTPLARNPKFLKHPDGRQQLTYTSETEYPADDVVAFLESELKRRGWKALPQDFLNPDIPSSIQRGWEVFEDQSKKPAKTTWQWGADWENARHDVTRYFLKFESTTNSTRDLRELSVMAIYIPAEVAAGMKPAAKK